MIEHTITKLIRLPRHSVFDMLQQPEIIPAWNPAIESVQLVTPGHVRTGSRFRLRRSDPRPAIEEVEVIEYEPDRRFALHGDFGPFTGDLHYRLEETSEGTRLQHEAYLEPKGPVRLIAPLAAARVRAAVSDNLDRLREFLETSARTRRMASVAGPDRAPHATRS